MKQTILFTAALVVIGCTSCRKADMNGVVPATNGEMKNLSTSSKSTAEEGNLFNWYGSLNRRTLEELQQARGATARYQNLNNALADGYRDIEVDVEHMGHHYMNSSLVDGNFDIRKPEILVYNRLADGTPVLVAVEYALPISEPRPEGFYGSADVWNGSSPFPLWLLHAWVWAYNPEGAFNWTNPLIELH